MKTNPSLFPIRLCWSIASLLYDTFLVLALFCSVLWWKGPQQIVFAKLQYLQAFASAEGDWRLKERTNQSIPLLCFRLLLAVAAFSHWIQVSSDRSPSVFPALVGKPLLWLERLLGGLTFWLWKPHSYPTSPESKWGLHFCLSLGCPVWLIHNSNTWVISFLG